jgi:hypothetical protein
MGGITKNEFLLRAKKIHGDSYEYKEVNYVNYSTKVTFQCNNCMRLCEVKPQVHISKGVGCKVCTKNRQSDKCRKGTEKFVEESREIHKDKYDYSKVEYKTTHANVTIICKIHGEFEQSPSNHLRSKYACVKCFRKEKFKNQHYTQDNFITKAINVHGSTYSYEFVEYVNSYCKKYEIPHLF